MVPALSDLVSVVEPIMRNAGDRVMAHFNKRVPARLKQGGNQGTVTAADIESEQYLIKELINLIPEAGILAEESGTRQSNSDYCWVIDPLDGTTNFTHGLPFFCISVALTYKGQPVWGAVYQPLLHEFFYAYKSGGAFLNGSRIMVSNPELDQSLIVIGLPYAKNDWFDRLINSLEVVGPRIFAIRHLGAAALDLAYVACGRLDGHYLADLTWWDVAAGMLLVTEAGGKVTNFQGGVIDQHYSTLLAAGPQVYERLRGVLEKAKV